MYNISVNCTHHVYPFQDANTPLHLAAWVGHTTCVKRLLSAPGIDVNVSNHVQQTPLMMATKYDVIKLLQMYTTCYEDYPVHTFSKVILCGHTGAGKSSLAKVKWIEPGLLGDHIFDSNAYRACWDGLGPVHFM